MKKTWIMLLTGMLVIGLIPGAMANPKIDSNSQAQNEKQLTVTVDGANAADAAINQILTNNGAQDNHNAGIGGNANAISGNIATLNQNAGNDNLLALAEIDVHQSLTQPVDIREFQVANTHEDSSIDLNIPVFDNMDSMIEIEKENPIVGYHQ